MTPEPTPCPDRELLKLVMEGRGPPEQGEALARHVEGCPDCMLLADIIRRDPMPRPPEKFNRPWPAFFGFAAFLMVLYAAIYCVVEQAHR